VPNYRAAKPVTGPQCARNMESSAMGQSLTRRRAIKVVRFWARCVNREYDRGHGHGPLRLPTLRPPSAAAALLGADAICHS
jgi:hypothetical protein